MGRKKRKVDQAPGSVLVRLSCGLKGMIDIARLYKLYNGGCQLRRTEEAKRKAILFSKKNRTNLCNVTRISTHRRRMEGWV